MAYGAHGNGVVSTLVKASGTQGTSPGLSLPPFNRSFRVPGLLPNIGPGLKGLAALAAVALWGISAAVGAPITPNGSFGFIPFGPTTAKTSSGWEIGPNSTVITVAAAELVNTTTAGASYLGIPDTIGIATYSAVALGQTTFNVPTLNVLTTLGTPLTLSVTNAASDVETFTFYDVTATSSGNGTLNLSWLGDLTSDSLGVFTEPVAANLTAAFAASSASSVGNVSFAVDISANSLSQTQDSGLPEPAALPIVVVGLIGLWAVRRRAAARGAIAR